MQAVTLNANIRKDTGRSAANQLRRQGRVPGIFYTHNGSNIAIEVKALDLRSLVYTADTHIVDLLIGADAVRKCILKGVQFDPVTDNIVHFDLMGVAMTDRIKVEVPIVLTGTAKGLKQGGMLNHLIHKVEIECLVSDLPDHIEIDVSNLGVGESFTIGQISTANYVIHSEPEVPVVTVSHARAVVETAAPAEEEAPSEPVVIARGKAADEEQ